MTKFSFSVGLMLLALVYTNAVTIIGNGSIVIGDNGTDELNT